MSQSSLSNKVQLILIAAGLGLFAASVWILGSVMSSDLIKFVGFMAGASTFVPLPADTYILSVSDNLSPLSIGVVGGAVNAAVVLIEAIWFRMIASYPQFAKLKEFFGSNKYVQKAQENIFVGLVFGGISPLPFEPFRLLAALTNYSAWRYALATFVGRGLRYYCIARVGEKFTELGYFKYIIWGSVFLFLFGLIRSFIKFNSLQDT